MAVEKLNPSKLPDTSAVMALFEANYKAALPDELEQIKEGVKANTAGMGEPVMLFDVKALSLGTFCTQWPKIKWGLNTLLRTFGWVMPGPAAMAKAFLVTFEATVLPIVCPVPPAE